MQNTSQAWKDNQNSQLVSESFVEISLDITDPVSTDDATATDNGSVVFSNTDGIIGTSEEEITPYATLEQNMWVLDGTKEVIPQDSAEYENAGYISDILSGENGEFSSPPTVTINFNEIHEVPIQGITVTWGKTQGDYPTDFTVTAYNGETVVGEKIVSGNTNVLSIVLFDIVNYDKITIAINKWCLPYRRARIEDILVGIRKVYTKSDLFSFSHSQELDLISASLPKGTVTFEVDNYNREYDVYNTEGLAKYLTERQELKVKYGYKINGETEWIDGGVYYLSSWESKENSNSAKFEANLLFENLSMIYNQGVYSADGRSLYDLAIDVLTFADLPLSDSGDVRWVIDESLKDITTVAPLPLDTVANCLQYIANAGCCILYQDRKGYIHIEKREYAPDDYSINPTNSFSKPSITLSKPIKNINVSFYDYTLDEERWIGTISKIKIREGGVYNFRVEYKYAGESVMAKDCYISINGASTYATVTKQNFYDTHADIQLIGNADLNSGTLTIYLYGTVYYVSTNNIDVNVRNDGEELAIDNPLIASYDHALMVAEWVKNALTNRQTVSFSWRADPRLDAGDVVESVDKYNTNNVIMTKVDYSYNGAFRGSGEGRVV